MVFADGQPGHTTEHNSARDDITALQAQVAQLTTQVNALQPVATGGAIAIPRFGEIALSSSAFGGSSTSADDRMTNALSYLGAQTHSQTLYCDLVDVTFTRSNPAPSGLDLVFPNWGWMAQEVNAKYSWPVTVNCGSGTSSWWVGNASATTSGFNIRGLCVKSSNDATQLFASGSLFYGCVFDTLQTIGMKYVWGNPTTAFNHDAMSWDGPMSFNNAQGTIFTLVGSDSLGLKPTIMNAGGPSKKHDGTTFDPQGQPLGILKFNGKWAGANWYFTCNGGWGGLLFQGNATAAVGGTLTNCVLEGINAAGPSASSLIRIEGGSLTLRDSNLNYAMANPTANGRTDQAIIHVEKGRFYGDSITYDRATSVAETVPLMYVNTANGGKGRITNVDTGAKGGTWVALPRTVNAWGSDATTQPA